MVYNTTDNRSSLSITDLTSDGEYSVTVAGRDGGRTTWTRQRTTEYQLERQAFINHAGSSCDVQKLIIKHRDRHE